jgi:hypothetical protein
MPISQKCDDIDVQACLYPSTRGLPGLGYYPFHIGKNLHLFSFFSKSWDACCSCVPNDLHCSRGHSARRGRQTQRERIIRGDCVWIVQITFFHLSESFLLTREQKINDVSYHHYYSLTSSGGFRATEGRTCDASEFDAAHTQV